MRLSFKRGLLTWSARTNKDPRKSGPIILREQRARYFNFYAHDKIIITIIIIMARYLKKRAKEDPVNHNHTVFFFKLSAYTQSRHILSTYIVCIEQTLKRPFLINKYNKHTMA